jgi:hypothetical protein
MADRDEAPAVHVQHRRAGNEVHELWPLPGQHLLELRVVEVEPARPARRRGFRVDGDQLQEGQWPGLGVVDAHQAVVGGKRSVPPTRAGLDAECGAAPGHAFFKRGAGQHEVVEDGGAHRAGCRTFRP